VASASDLEGFRLFVAAMRLRTEIRCAEAGRGKPLESQNLTLAPSSGRRPKFWLSQYRRASVWAAAAR